MSGYSPDEKLRLQQLRVLRRRWLRDQELSEREPVLPRRQLGPVAAFWERFLQPGGLWRQQVYKACQTGGFVLTRVLVPAWIILYCLKYHVMKTPHGVVMSNPRIFPGDRILETGEIIPPLKEEPARPLITPLVGTGTSSAMASTGVKTPLQAKEIREAMDPTLGTRAQPAAPTCLLGPGAPQGLTRPAAISFLGVEFPRSAPPPNCGTLKRTFACTNLLLLSLADHDAAADGGTSPGPHLHSPCPKDNTEPAALPFQQEHSSPHLACPAEDDDTQCAGGPPARCKTPQR